MEELGHREAGTAGELKAAERLKERLDGRGCPAEIQSFTFDRFDVAYFPQTRGGNARVVVGSPLGVLMPGLILTPNHAGGRESGSLGPVGPGGSEDLTKEELAGKIALLLPGDIPVNDPQTLQTLQEGQQCRSRWGYCRRHFRQSGEFGRISPAIHRQDHNSSPDPP